VSDAPDLNDRLRAGTLPKSPDTEETSVTRLRVVDGKAPQATPLANPQAERAILAAIMWSALYGEGALRPTNIFDLVNPSMFSAHASTLLASTMWDCDKEKVSCTPTALHGKLAQVGKSRDVGGLVALEQLVENATPTTAPQLRVYAELVRDAWALREIVAHGKQLETSITGGRMAVDAVVVELRAVADRIDQSIVADAGIVSAKDAAQQLAKDIGHQTALGIDTGFNGFDTYFGGFVPCDVTLLCARTSVGKSALAYQLVEGAVTRNESAAALYVSMEMPPRDFVTRAAAGSAHVAIDTIRKKAYTPDETARLTASLVTISKRPIWFNEKQSQTMTSIARLVEKTATAALRRGKKLRVVVIDHVLLITQRGERRDGDKAGLMAEVSGWMKRMAGHYEIAVLGLAQISREAEKQPGSKRPKLHQIRWGSSFEEDADNVAIIHRARKKDGGGFLEGPAEVLVEKNRMGKLGMFMLDIEPRFTRFSNIVEHPKIADRSNVAKEPMDDGVAWNRKKVDWHGAGAGDDDGSISALVTR
jgi:replicative DNA helicase